MKKSYRVRFFNLSLVFFLVIGLLLPYNSFSRTVYASEIPVIIPPDIDDVTDTVSVLLPMVISSSNNTSLVKYNPWKNKIKAAINTLITLGVYNLVQVANDLGVTVNTLVGGTVTFSYNTYRFINDVWKTIKDTDGITDNSTGTVQDDTAGTLPDNVYHYTPSYYSNIGYNTGSSFVGYFLSTDKNIYCLRMTDDNKYFRSYSNNLPITTLAVRDPYFMPFTMYSGSINDSNSHTFNVSAVDNNDYRTRLYCYNHNRDGSSNNNYISMLSVLTTQENETVNQTYRIADVNYNPSRTFSYDSVLTNSYSYTYGYDFVFIQYVKPYYDVSPYPNKYSQGFAWNYYYNYTGTISVYDANTNSNTNLPVSHISDFPIQMYLNDFSDKRSMSFDNNELGVLDYGGYTVGNSQPDVYDNPFYENKINYDEYNGDNWEELKQLIIQSYDNGTQISDYTRELYDVNTQQLVSIQNIDSTNNSILQLLLNGNEYTDGYINSQSDTLTDFDNITSDYYSYEDQFIDNFNGSVSNLQFDNPNDWGSSFIASSNWVKEQYDRMTVNTQIGKVLGFSMALGFVLLLIGRLLR